MTKKSAQRKIPRSRRLLSWKQIHSEKVNICRSHAHELMKQGLFPLPTKLFSNSRKNYWLESDIDDWIVSRVEASADRGDL